MASPEQEQILALVARCERLEASRDAWREAAEALDDRMKWCNDSLCTDPLCRESDQAASALARARELDGGEG